MERNVIITGANRGIGLEFARQYKALGWKVWAICRSTSEPLENLNVSVLSGIDIGAPQSMTSLAKFGPNAVHLLINNAGILKRENLGSLAPESIIEQFRINALGPLLITEAFASRLVEGGKVALITSRMGSVADNTSGGYYGYRMSKAALNAAGKSLAIDLAPRRIAVGLFHPGYVRTGMTGMHGDVTPEEAARDLMNRIDELDMKNSGRFYHAKGTELPW